MDCTSNAPVDQSPWWQKRLAGWLVWCRSRLLLEKTEFCMQLIVRQYSVNLNFFNQCSIFTLSAKKTK